MAPSNTSNEKNKEGIRDNDHKIGEGNTIRPYIATEIQSTFLKPDIMKEKEYKTYTQTNTYQ